MNFSELWPWGTVTMLGPSISLQSAKCGQGYGGYWARGAWLGLWIMVLRSMLFWSTSQYWNAENPCAVTFPLLSWDKPQWVLAVTCCAINRYGFNIITLWVLVQLYLWTFCKGNRKFHPEMEVQTEIGNIDLPTVIYILQLTREDIIPLKLSFLFNYFPLFSFYVLASMPTM